jgi:hypothetical protein
MTEDELFHLFGIGGILVIGSPGVMAISVVGGMALCFVGFVIAITSVVIGDRERNMYRTHLKCGSTDVKQ